MKHPLIILSLTLLFIAGCRSEQPAEQPTATLEQTAEEELPAAEPEIIDGTQVITIVVRNTGYEPARIRLHAGMPARLIFDQQGTTECASEIQIPGLGVRKTKLPPGQKTVIEFIPEESGTFTFTCGMNMLKGTIMVKS